MFDKIGEKIENIRKAKEELRDILEQEDYPTASEVQE
jgi:protein-arginine kinase activator protein McsA